MFLWCFRHRLHVLGRGFPYVKLKIKGKNCKNPILLVFIPLVVYEFLHDFFLIIPDKNLKHVYINFCIVQTKTYCFRQIRPPGFPWCISGPFYVLSISSTIRCQFTRIKITEVVKNSPFFFKSTRIKITEEIKNLLKELHDNWQLNRHKHNLVSKTMLKKTEAVSHLLKKWTVPIMNQRCKQREKKKKKKKTDLIDQDCQTKAEL